LSNVLAGSDDPAEIYLNGLDWYSDNRIDLRAGVRVVRVDAVCPHRGGPLADGLIDGQVVICPLHGHTFDMCSGAEAGGDLSVRSYSVSAVEGSIRLSLDDG
jgi:nitrite reductase/ring-hydroxylating ferredoxin subunit